MVTGDETRFSETFDGLMDLVARLRGPDGCPWDREQTRVSMARYVLEECYELLDAMENSDGGGIAEEIGDVMFHLAFQVQLGKEDRSFDERRVFRALIDKLTRRHPHVFGEAEVSSAREVVDNWQALKRKERAGAETSALAGVPKEMPALAQAQAVQVRAAGAGFDWEDPQGALGKVSEELAELDRAGSPGEREAELGDVLFSIVNASRWMDIDAEGALRTSTARFRRRFALMERLSRERHTDFEELSLGEKEALWQEAKRQLD
jgi:tetrapyrrole methylase family protein/MazG family protein